MTSTLRIKASQISPYFKGKNTHKGMVSIALNQSILLDIFVALIRSKIEFQWD
tara:strand:- start:4193 stop:4351 length:159 start_codon:yes stop_codon:yes gene_type:complete